MPRKHGNRRAPHTAAALIILLASLGLAACGGSSKDPSGVTNASAKGKSRQSAAGASKLRTCLQKEGIALPKRPSGRGPRIAAPGGGPYGGQAPGGGGPFLSGPRAGLHLPKGVTRAQFEAALKKCGGRALGRFGRGFGPGRAPQRLAKFAQCMRKNGIDLPEPDTSGRGPIFNTKGIDTSSAAFKSAYAKCGKELGGPRGPGAAGPPAGANVPPGGAGAQAGVPPAAYGAAPPPAGE